MRVGNNVRHRRSTSIGTAVPSWNIHIAQTEQLFGRDGAVAHRVLDRNAFLLGAFLPDIPVGYMVPGIEEPIAYRITHFAKPEFIPKPREEEFWHDYVVPAARGLKEAASASPGSAPILASSIKQEVERVNYVHYPQRYEGIAEVPRNVSDVRDAETSADAIARSRFDLTLGVWSHLLADRIWNRRVNEYLESIGGVPSEHFRIKKQGDFDAFGKTLAIELVPRPTPRLLATAAAFPQYRIDEPTVYKTIGVAHEIVRTNKAPAEPNHYRLLTDEFFDRTFTEVIDSTDRLIGERLQ